jgi:hypothetical protein
MKLARWAVASGTAATVGAGVPRLAEACHEESSGPGYREEVSVGLSFGVAFGGVTGLRFLYGLDVRVAPWRQGGALLRVEGRGLRTIRAVLAGHAVTDGDVALELGLAAQTSVADAGLGSALGAHLGAGLFDDGLGVQVHAGIPFLGDLRAWEAGAAAVYAPTEVCLASGRRLRDGDGAVLPGVAALDGAAGGALARAWIEDARAEYASIAAFERMAAELAAAGAPPALARAARAAAADEARHAALCAREAGAPFWLLPLAQRLSEARWTRPSDDALATLAREAWIDGCLGEGIAAAQAARAADAARGAPAATQRAIAGDERRHAELAWAVLAWAWEAGGPAARDAIAAATAGEPAVPTAAPLADDPERLAAAGRIAPDAAREAAEREVAEAARRVRRAIG